MTTVVNVYDAKTRLSSLLASVEAGEDIVIARAGRPVARLVRIVTPAGQQPGRGSASGRIVLPPDFDDPLPDIEAAIEASTS
ncbi:MAG: type II toxin-antitoxin system prevent-host-death family antitoxin [Actinomycetales bacterium]|nr:type II toxin-antitoxin system prevent-host-death family antitoxin [Actinomycetales bacterium]